MTRISASRDERRHPSWAPWSFVGAALVGALALGACDEAAVAPEDDPPVLSGLALDQITAGASHTCGLETTTGQAYCWGRNSDGQLGDGTTTLLRGTPVAVDQTVLGGISFDQIVAGFSHTCGLETGSGQAYCWGDNSLGQIGDGTTGPPSPTPVAVDQTVLGGISFDRISTFGNHTCGVDAASGQAYCWGANHWGQAGNGQFGDGTPGSPRPTPVAVDQSVAGGVSFDDIAAATALSCGLDGSTGQAYCWGANHRGRLGGGTESEREPTPIAVDQTVLGGITFDRIAAGASHVCGLEAASGQGYCWGENGAGGLGDGSTTFPLTPVAVDQTVGGWPLFRRDRCRRLAHLRAGDRLGSGLLLGPRRRRPARAGDDDLASVHPARRRSERPGRRFLRPDRGRAVPHLRARHRDRPGLLLGIEPVRPTR